jgi:hypothetical protein
VTQSPFGSSEPDQALKGLLDECTAVGAAGVESGLRSDNDEFALLTLAISGKFDEFSEDLRSAFDLASGA